jgi:hypothetical protein
MGMVKKSSELVGMSQSDKDVYIESLLKEISDLKKQIRVKLCDINENSLEELDGINVDDLNETITLRAPNEDESDDETEGFDSSSILNMLGSFMNNDMLTGDPSHIENNGDQVNPMLKMFAKMMEGMGENMQSVDEADSDQDDASDSKPATHEKLE